MGAGVKRLANVSFVRMENVEEVQSIARHGARMFGARVKAFRAASGLTQEDLARLMTSAGYAVHQTTIAKLESAVRPTSVEEAYALAAVFRVPVHDLLVAEDDDEQLTVRLELAAHATKLKALGAELADLGRREDELREQYEAAEALYRQTERRLSQHAPGSGLKTAAAVGDADADSTMARGYAAGYGAAAALTGPPRRAHDTPHETGVG